MSESIEQAAALVGRVRRQAVIYLRVSTKKQVNKAINPDGYSLPTQRDACLRKAGDLDADVAEVFIDRGESAKTTDREDFQRMLVYLRAHPDIDYVIVYRINRFARDSYDDATLDRELHAMGVELVSATEHIDRTPAGRLNHRMLAAMAEYESANLAVETMRGMRHKAQEEGGTNYRTPSGYLNTVIEVSDPRTKTLRRVKTVILDEERNKHMAWLFQAYESGNWTDQDLADELASRGIRQRATAKFPERPYTAGAIAKILTNRYYLGETKFEGVWHKGAHPALVDLATFERVQAIRLIRHATGEKTRYGHNYLMGSLHCAQCGDQLGIMRSRNRWGTIYHYFHCLGRKSHRTQCPQPHVAISHLEQAVVDYWRRMTTPESTLKALRRKVLAEVAEDNQRSQARLAAQTKKLGALEQERKRLLTAYYSEAIPVDLLREEQERISRELAQARQIIDNCAEDYNAAKAGFEHAVAICQNAYDLYTNADADVRRMLNKDVFEKLWIKDDRVVGADVTPLYREVLSIADADTERSMYARALPGGAAHLSHALQCVSRLLAFERPFGWLTWEIKTKFGFWESRGLSGTILVTLARATPNPELIKYVQRYNTNNNQKESV